MSWDLNISTWEPVILDPANGPRSGRSAIIPNRQTVSPPPGFDSALMKLKGKVVEDQNQIVLYEQGGTSNGQQRPDVLTGAGSGAQVVRCDMIQRPVSPPPGFEPHAANAFKRKALLEIPAQYVKKEVIFGEASTRPGMKVYPCTKCRAIFDTPQRYAAHSTSHYRNETPEERKRRREAKIKVVKLYPVYSRVEELLTTMTSKLSDCKKIKWVSGDGIAGPSGSAPWSSKKA